MTLASQLTERVSIQQQVRVDDGYGGQTVSWSELANVFANVTPVYVSDSERVIGDQLNARAGYRVKVRLRTDIKASMRVVWKSRTLVIHSLHETGEALSILTYEENL
ncbi:MAG: phage head closure protein [Pseudomonadota bacterium]